jgi:hypothetical protein
MGVRVKVRDSGGDRGWSVGFRLVCWVQVGLLGWRRNVMGSRDTSNDSGYCLDVCLVGVIVGYVMAWKGFADSRLASDRWLLGLGGCVWSLFMPELPISVRDMGWFPW